MSDIIDTGPDLAVFESQGRAGLAPFCRPRPLDGPGSGAAFTGAVRWVTFFHVGLRGEGSIPVPLPPPAWPKPCILCANLLAIWPNSSSDFSCELRTYNGQSRLILLRKAHFSPQLWTLRIRYGSRNLPAIPVLREFPFFDEKGPPNAGFSYRRKSPETGVRTFSAKNFRKSPAESKKTPVFWRLVLETEE